MEEERRLAISGILGESIPKRGSSQGLTHKALRYRPLLSTDSAGRFRSDLFFASPEYVSALAGFSAGRL